ncbi:NAD synthetase [Devosia riboflavina]|uniref:NH(3)-dependent NAD(+) synthetase n=1 Tax=Devosia riboflavina TaxID=46914 RepID=A0A087M2M6_9HYPH|nr:ammonia-dependent NAD(+) synthetase [Devosia riboflavina]KFL31129.1 NAD synthetase [Devosia riboflavina]
MTSQFDIIRELGVEPSFDVAHEATRRLAFLKSYLLRSGLHNLVLGISGGIDSTTAGILAQQSVKELRATGFNARFIAVRLPYGRQADAADADAALATIDPDLTFEVDIAPATDATWHSLRRAGFASASAAQADFLRGNVKARQRMIAQYALAGGTEALVIGTDHAAEAVMGFFTKFGDGAADLLPLAGLTKRRVRALAAHLGAPESLVKKIPTADLEDLAPLRPDEDAHGLTYEQIDDFLEGKSIEPRVADIILARYRATAHKRALPASPVGLHHV